MVNQSKTFHIPTGIAAIVLLAPALVAWAADWRWLPDGGGAWVTAALCITNTGGFPYAVVTSLVLAGMLMCMSTRTRARMLAILALCVAAILCGQGIKSAVKNIFREPRPYVEWLAKNHTLESTQSFYAMPRDARAAWLANNITSDASAPVPANLRAHWTHDTGYSFPSGHTTFASTWALLCVALLWPGGRRGHRVFCVAVIAWALGVETTRLVLGMHWPRDIAAGVLLGWVVVACLAAIWKKIIMRGAPPATP